MNEIFNELNTCKLPKYKHRRVKSNIIITNNNLCNSDYTITRSKSENDLSIFNTEPNDLIKFKNKIFNNLKNKILILIKNKIDKWFITINKNYNYNYDVIEKHFLLFKDLYLYYVLLGNLIKEINHTKNIDNFISKLEMNTDEFLIKNNGRFIIIHDYITKNIPILTVKEYKNHQLSNTHISGDNINIILFYLNDINNIIYKICNKKLNKKYTFPQFTTTNNNKTISNHFNTIKYSSIDSIILNLNIIYNEYILPFNQTIYNNIFVIKTNKIDINQNFIGFKDLLKKQLFVFLYNYEDKIKNLLFLLWMKSKNKLLNKTIKNYNCILDNFYDSHSIKIGNEIFGYLNFDFIVDTNFFN